MPEAEYIALKRMKVQELDQDGNTVLVDGRPVLRVVQPGDPIPEAASWANLYKEVRAGRVGFAGSPLAGGPAVADLRRAELTQGGTSKAAQTAQKRKKDADRKKAARKKAAAAKRASGASAAGDVAVANATGKPPPEAAPQSVAKEA